MRSTFDLLLERFRANEFTWPAVKGLTGAVIMTLRRLGWVPQSFCVWSLPSGLSLDLEKVRE
eukprot:3170866-Pyramimonas_sp.AAC.1